VCRAIDLGIGSGLAGVGRYTFVALPDPGTDANPYNPLLDDTVSYSRAFKPVSEPRANLRPVNDCRSTLTLDATDTTPIKPVTVDGWQWSGAGIRSRVTPLGSGAPGMNSIDAHNYFSDVSDNFDPSTPP